MGSGTAFLGVSCGIISKLNVSSRSFDLQSFIERFGRTFDKEGTTNTRRNMGKCKGYIQNEMKRGRDEANLNCLFPEYQKKK